MKIKFLPLVVLLCLASAVAQNSAETDEQRIKDLIVNSFQDLLSDNKQEMLEEYYTQDLVLLERGRGVGS